MKFPGRHSLIIFLSIVLSGCSLPLLGKKNAGLRVNATPIATVSLDNQKLGQTPFQKAIFAPGKHHLALSSDSGQKWETDVVMNNDLETVVDYTFGSSETESSGFTMALEKNGASDSQISVSTDPDRSIIRVDGQPRGFSPLTNSVVAEGSHDVVISSAGFSERQAQISVPKGYRLLLFVRLSRSNMTPPEEENSDTTSEDVTPTLTPTPGKAKPTTKPTTKPTVATAIPTPTKKATTTVTPALTQTPPERPYVEILSTPTGWLKVRSDPSTSTEDNVITKVYPGETYPYLETNETGWFKITTKDGTEGWISGQYAKVYK